MFSEQDQNKSNKQKLAIVEAAIKNISNKHGILSLSDVVWNHTSDSTEFLLKHPEAGKKKYLYGMPFLFFFLLYITKLFFYLHHQATIFIIHPIWYLHMNWIQH